jgi:hypothetical protein
MEHNKALGHDGFPAEFYQKFWDVIKGDLLEMFHELHTRTLPLFSLNFGVITLIPKVHEANQIQQYRPICLMNVSFKIFTKEATNRVNVIAYRLFAQLKQLSCEDVTSYRVSLFYMKPYMIYTRKNNLVSSSKLILRKHMTKYGGPS